MPGTWFALFWDCPEPDHLYSVAASGDRADYPRLLALVAEHYAIYHPELPVPEGPKIIERDR